MPNSCCTQTTSTLRDVQKIRRAQIGRQILLRDFEAHFRRVIVIHRSISLTGTTKHWVVRKFRRHAQRRVCRESGDAAFPRQIVAEKRDLPKLRRGGQKFARFDLARYIIPPRDLVTIGPISQCSI